MVPSPFYIFLKRVIPYVFWSSCLITIVLTLMPSNELPSSIKIWDKAEHAIVFFIMMFSGGIAYSRYKYLLAIALVAYGASIEVMQEYFTTSRNGDKFDIVADAVGVLIGFILFLIVYKLSHKPSKKSIDSV